MRIRWLKIPIAILFIALLLVPLVLIWALTNMEMQQYEQVYIPTVAIKSYGDPVPVERRDMKEFITISGTYVSVEQFFMELPRMKNAYSARLLVNIGDYIYKDEIIGYSEDGLTEILSTENGVIREIHLGDYSYFSMENDENVALSCLADDKLLTIFNRDTLALSDEKGNAVRILEIDRLINENGQTRVLLKLNDGVYGSSVTGLKLYTGKVYTKALIVPSDCLFRLPENPKQWCVRVLDNDRNAVGNQPVQIGFSDGEYTCVTGIEEGTLIDSGYAKVMGGGE